MIKKVDRKIFWKDFEDLSPMTPNKKALTMKPYHCINLKLNSYGNMLYFSNTILKNGCIDKIPDIINFDSESC